MAPEASGRLLSAAAGLLALGPSLRTCMQSQGHRRRVRGECPPQPTGSGDAQRSALSGGEQLRARCHGKLKRAGRSPPAPPTLRR